MKTRTRSRDVVHAEVTNNGILSNDILAKLSKNPDFIQAVSEMLAPGVITKPPEEGPTTTPGPWKFRGSGALVNKKGEQIGTFHGAQRAGRRGYSNRNLIRQAPELLALAKKVSSHFPADDPLAKEAKALVERSQP